MVLNSGVLMIFLQAIGGFATLAPRCRLGVNRS